MGPQNQNQQPKVVIVRHYRSSAREFIAWFKIVAVSGIVILVAGSYLVNQFIGQPSTAHPAITKQPKAPSPSRFKECDYTKPGSSVRKICEEQAAAKQKPSVSEN